MRVVLLVDESLFDSDDKGFSARSWPKHSAAEYSVSHALRKLGHQVIGIPATADIVGTLLAIRDAKPDLVFNMVEEIGGRRELDNLIIRALELMNVPYTGASPDTLMLARNKYFSKLVVAQAGVLVPQGCVIYKGSDLLRRDLVFPAILKPLIRDGSEGITTTSYVASRSQLRQRASRLMRWAPLLCEEYIPGRELIVTMSGDKRCTVNSICEMVFPGDSPVKFATARAKFDAAYRARFGIRYETPARIEPELRRKLHSVARTSYQALRINAYAKLEFRIDGDRIVFIEANPNSQLSRFANTTDFASIGYEKFIRKIIRMALY